VVVVGLVVVVVGLVVVVVGLVVVVVGATVVLVVLVLVLVVVVGATVVVVVVVGPTPEVTPQVTWPTYRSPMAVGPMRCSWRAVTVSEPSGFTVCSLKMKSKLSPTFWISPWMTVLGAGLSGTGTTVSSASVAPWEVTTVPPTTVVNPVTPLSDAVQVLSREVAVNTSCWDVLMGARLAVLVTDPVGPVVPWVLTVVGPAVKSLAGPMTTFDVGDVAVIGTAEPPGGRLTMGVGPKGPCGPPKRVMFCAVIPMACPLTAVTSAPALPWPTPATTSAAIAKMSPQTIARRRAGVRFCSMCSPFEWFEGSRVRGFEGSRLVVARAT